MPVVPIAAADLADQSLLLTSLKCHSRTGQFFSGKRGQDIKILGVAWGAANFARVLRLPGAKLAPLPRFSGPDLLAGFVNDAGSDFGILKVEPPPECRGKFLAARGVRQAVDQQLLLNSAIPCPVLD